MIARLKHGDCVVRSEEVVNCAVQWQVLEFGVNFMEPDYLQLQIKSVILHLYSTLALPSWHGNSVSIQLTMCFLEYPDPDFAGSVNSINYIFWM